MHTFNLVWVGLTSPSSSYFLLKLSTIYQKVLLRTQYGKWMSQPSLGCSRQPELFVSCYTASLPDHTYSWRWKPKDHLWWIFTHEVAHPAADAWFTQSERASSAYLSHTCSPPAPAWSPQLPGTDGCCLPGLLAHTVGHGTPVWSPDEGTGGRAWTSGAGRQWGLPGPCPGRRGRNGTSPQVAGTQS